jgi:predicted nucleic acid-binding OB-fold protein
MGVELVITFELLRTLKGLGLLVAWALLLNRKIHTFQSYALT